MFKYIFFFLPRLTRNSAHCFLSLMYCLMVTYETISTYVSFIKDCFCIFLDDEYNYYLLVCVTLDQRRNSRVPDFYLNVSLIITNQCLVRCCCLFTCIFTVKQHMTHKTFNIIRMICVVTLFHCRK